MLILKLTTAKFPLFRFDKPVSYAVIEMQSKQKLANVTTLPCNIPGCLPYKYSNFYITVLLFGPLPTLFKIQMMSDNEEDAAQ